MAFGRDGGVSESGREPLRSRESTPLGGGAARVRLRALVFLQIPRGESERGGGFCELARGLRGNPYLSFYFQAHEHLVISCLLFLGEWGHALRRIEQRVRLVEKNGDSQTTTIATLGRSRVHIHAMDFAGAQQILESALLGVTPVPNLHRFWLLWAGAAEAGLGHYERALEYLLKCREVMDQHPTITDWSNRMPVQWTLAEVWLSKGDLEKARVEAEQFLAVTLPSEER